MPGKFGQSLIDLSNFLWGTPLLILLFSGGLFFFISSGLKPLRYVGHALAILKGKFDKEDEPGQISHYQALSTALAGTVGMGNISGVALAIIMGGPGTIFWMWISALLGMLTKYFTCTLAVMFRGYDSKGELQGGPMYYIVEGLGKNWKPLAVFFSLVAMIGVSPMFQANQLTQAFVDIVLVPNGVRESIILRFTIGIIITIIVALVVFGGIKRIAKVAGSLVPLMVVIYIISVLSILILNSSEIIPSFKLIIHDAFTARSVMGGALGSLIIMGFRRAAFSNEAGIGTAPMAHGAAKTKEPVREGLVAMLGPFIDTIIVCTMTALAIIITGVWIDSSEEGISLTSKAFEVGIPYIGKYILISCVSIFALTTLFAFPYYGTKAFSYVFGAEYGNIYKYLYVASISLGAVSSLDVVISIFDSAYALMAFPTMLSAILLSPHVVRETKKYFNKYEKGDFNLKK
ncbi:MAG: alanine:cation symporter family protein [Bacteroidales bacterium]|nr:alanine:cation symporter family protein [Bacteroidales bacterium]